MHEGRRDFRLFWAGQTVSQLGSAFSLLALPLLVLHLTGSARQLALATATGFLPYLLFGLPIGALVDRLNRKAIMIATDLGRALAVATVPLLATLGALHVWWIYVIAFAATTLSIAFDAGQFAAVPALVGRAELVAANSRLLLGEQVAHVCGPLLAGALLAVGVATANVLYADAASFLVSAGSLALIRRPFGGAAPAAGGSILADVREGVRYVLGEPLL
ncbi:MAG TPA: MFS transporter, partial [Gaiellaceae bacterium]|nr:MFS transporter [Gaiellaceae bacterium]